MTDEPLGLHGDPNAITGGEGNPAQLQWPNETEETDAQTQGLVTEPAAKKRPLRRASEGEGQA